MKIAFEKIKSKRNESQIRDNKSFGKLVADDEQIKEIRESFRTAITDQAERFKQLIESLDGSTEDKRRFKRKPKKFENRMVGEFKGQPRGVSSSYQGNQK